MYPQKTGSKNGTAWNKTTANIESKIIELAKEHLFLGPIWIAEQLENIVDQSKVYRILKRNNVRYYDSYRYKKKKRKRYCLDSPGRELQMDTKYPFGHARKAVV